MEFVAIDVETANADMSSICQVGLALYRKGKLIEGWKTYIDPKDYFDEINVSIHGINEGTVKGAPVIADVSGEIYRFLDDRVSVCHTHFDRVAVQQAFEKYKLRHPRCRWLDSARVARRTWADFAQRGYGLDIDSWLRRVKQPIDPSGTGAGYAINRDGNPEGPLYGEVLVFTGALEIPRREAAGMAARIGCHVDPGVTKKTTILVVGDQDVKKLAGHEKSSKHRKVEELISKGRAIRILRETDFRELAQLAG